MNGLLQCRAIEAPDARLACQDEQLAIVAAALDEQRLVIIEQQAVRDVQRDSFGLSMPSLTGLRRIFGDRVDGNQDTVIAFEDGVRAESDASGRLASLEGLAVASVETDVRGRLIVTLENEQVWRQTDSTQIQRVRSRHFENDLTATIESGALGSYFMKLSHSPRRFRARRVR